MRFFVARFSHETDTFGPLLSSSNLARFALERVRGPIVPLDEL